MNFDSRRKNPSRVYGFQSNANKIAIHADNIAIQADKVAIDADIFRKKKHFVLIWLKGPLKKGANSLPFSQKHRLIRRVQHSWTTTRYTQIKHFFAWCFLVRFCFLVDALLRTRYVCVRWWRSAGHVLLYPSRGIVSFCHVWWLLRDIIEEEQLYSIEGTRISPRVSERLDPYPRFFRRRYASQEVQIRP